MGDDPMALLGLEGALKHYYYYAPSAKLSGYQRLGHREGLLRLFGPPRPEGPIQRDLDSSST
jgi:hypothetical protein